ncbi:MAG TPA: AEC family transporter [Rhodocyclaceae bacterium]|jgi:predicted permease|nr:AEC family transporter [Rhodocyclaceae bacterium]
MFELFLHHASLATPLFLLVLVGYALIRFGKWPEQTSEILSRFVFNVAMPALLFHLMSKFADLPPVDARLLIAYFGGCILTFVIGRLVAWKLFGLDGTGQSVFALGGIFSNTVLLGIPLAQLTLGDASLPPAALVIAFNALTLWTMVTISVEWSRHGSFSFKGIFKTAKSVLANPLVSSIVLGVLFSYTHLRLPYLVEEPLSLIASATMPLSLVALGMGLAEYGIKQGWQTSTAITVMKLVVQPLMVWAIGAAIGLPRLELRTIVLLASISIGINVYLMSRHFKAIEGPVASALVLTTLLASITVPIFLTLTE